MESSVADLAAWGTRILIDMRDMRRAAWFSSQMTLPLEHLPRTRRTHGRGRLGRCSR